MRSRALARRRRGLPATTDFITSLSVDSTVYAVTTKKVAKRTICGTGLYTPRGKQKGLEIFQALCCCGSTELCRLLPIFLQPPVDHGDGLIDCSQAHAFLRRDGLHQAVGALDVGRAVGQSPRRGGRGQERERRARVFFEGDRKSTRLNSSHTVISYAVFCLKKKTT